MPVEASIAPVARFVVGLRYRYVKRAEMAALPDLSGFEAQLTATLRQAVAGIIDENLRLRDLLHRMLDPEDLGWAVDEAVRKEVRRALSVGRTRHAEN